MKEEVGVGEEAEARSEKTFNSVCGYSDLS